jgi:hypothetical protein
MATRLEEPRALQAHSGHDRSGTYFYVGMAGAILLVMLLGFGRSYYFRAFTDAPPLPPFIHLHAIVFTGWVLFFLVQTVLVASGRPATHRRLGAAGAILAGVVILLGIATALQGARNGHNPGGPFPDALGFLITPLGDILLFAGFVLIALGYRRRREAHKRLMLLATVGGFLWPAITRLPYITGDFLLMFGLLTLFVLAGPVHDLMTRRRIHPVYVWGGLLILASFPIRRVIGTSEAWQRLAQWMIG